MWINKAQDEIENEKLKKIDVMMIVIDYEIEKDSREYIMDRMRQKRRD